MPTNSLQDFAEHLAQKLAGPGFYQADAAVALMWFHQHEESRTDSTVSELAQELEELDLTNGLNRTRLRDQLKAHKATKAGGRPQSFALQRAARQQLDKELSPLLRAPKRKIVDQLVPDSLFSGTRGYLEKLAYQINATYAYELYDGTATLMRRLVEGLIVECYIHAGVENAIKKPDGSFFMLDALVGVVKSGTPVRFGRSQPKCIEKVKEVGDRAAHDRFHITSQRDIDDVATGFRAVLSELKAKAGI